MLTDNLPTTPTPQNELPSASQSNSAISSTQSSTPSISDSPSTFSLDSVVASPANPTSSFLEEAQPPLASNQSQPPLRDIVSTPNSTLDSSSPTNSHDDHGSSYNISAVEASISDSQWLEPLYPEASITVCGAFSAIMHFSSRYKLSYTTMDGLLQLLRILCPPSSHLPSSFYTFKKFFEKFTPNSVHQTICLKCGGPDCSCVEVSGDNKAHLVNLEIQKPLEAIIQSMYYPKACSH